MSMNDSSCCCCCCIWCDWLNVTRQLATVSGMKEIQKREGVEIIDPSEE